MSDLSDLPTVTKEGSHVSVEPLANTAFRGGWVRHSGYSLSPSYSGTRYHLKSGLGSKYYENAAPNVHPERPESILMENKLQITDIRY